MMTTLLLCLWTEGDGGPAQISLELFTATDHVTYPTTAHTNVRRWTDRTIEIPRGFLDIRNEFFSPSRQNPNPATHTICATAVARVFQTCCLYPEYKQMISSRFGGTAEALFLQIQEIVLEFHEKSRHFEQFNLLENGKVSSRLLDTIQKPSATCLSFVHTFVTEIELKMPTIREPIIGQKLLHSIQSYQFHALHGAPGYKRLPEKFVVETINDPDFTKSFVEKETHKIQESLALAGLSMIDLWRYQVILEAYQHFLIYERSYSNIFLATMNPEGNDDDIILMAKCLAQIVVAHADAHDKTSCYDIGGCIGWANRTETVQRQCHQEFGHQNVTLYNLHVGSTTDFRMTHADQADRILLRRQNVRQPFYSERVTSLTSEQETSNGPTAVQTQLNDVSTKDQATSSASESALKFQRFNYLHKLIYNKNMAFKELQATKNLWTIDQELTTDAQNWFHHFVLSTDQETVHTIYLWKCMSPFWRSVGHISLKLGDTEGTYISYWPGQKKKLFAVSANQKTCLDDDIKAEGNRKPDKILKIPAVLLDGNKIKVWWDEKISNPKENKYLLFSRNCASVVCDALQSGLTVPEWIERFQTLDVKRPATVYRTMRTIKILYHDDMEHPEAPYRLPAYIHVAGYTRGTICRDRHKAVNPITEKLFARHFVKHVMENTPTIGSKSGTDSPLQDIQDSFLASTHSLQYLGMPSFGHDRNWRTERDASFRKSQKPLMSSKLEEKRIDPKVMLVYQLTQLIHHHFLIHEDMLIRINCSLNGSQDDGIIFMAQCLAKIFVKFVSSFSSSGSGKVGPFWGNHLGMAIDWARKSGLSEASHYFMYTFSTHCKWVSLYDLHFHPVAVFDDLENDSVWISEDYATRRMSSLETIQLLLPKIWSGCGGKSVYQHYRRPYSSEYWLEQDQNDDGVQPKADTERELVSLDLKQWKLWVQTQRKDEATSLSALLDGEVGFVLPGEGTSCQELVRILQEIDHQLYIHAEECVLIGDF